MEDGVAAIGAIATFSTVGTVEATGTARSGS